ncbi:MAG: preprotein translocase subunit SecG [Chitinophagaceae bacterium]|jgi:preprotein translocase subunit SecG|nr:preprotein translocase subunit SecG [Chitinophagaceae bacterium]
MTILFLVLIIVACVLLGLIVLIQNPKGGGLAGNIAGFSNQFMGVKQTTDVLEKGTWIFAGIVAFLCLISALLINNGSAGDNQMIKGVNTNTQTTLPSSQPANQQPVQQQPAQQNGTPAK